VGLLELGSQLLAAWDRVPPRRDHVLWKRIEPAPPEPREVVTRGQALPASAEDVARRIRTLRKIARDFGTTLPPDQLSDLLPVAAPDGPTRLEDYLRDRPELLADADRPGPVSRSWVASSREDRRARGQRYQRSAEALLSGPLARLRPWLRCIGVTGSTAYGEPEANDDLDFFVVTRPGTVAVFLSATYVALRIGRLRAGGAADPSPCFNYVVDARRAQADLASGRGLLFAREALTARMILGDEYYRGLLAGAPALGAELPRLYRTRTEAPGDAAPGSTPVALRLANAALFLPLAAYLQLVGLRRNALARRARRELDTFRTITAPDRVAFQSRRFEELRARYEELPDSGPMISSPARMSTAR
jgi:hypothetical protein